VTGNDGHGLFTARFRYDVSADLDERQRAILDRFDIFPLQGRLQQRALKQPVLPEPERGEDGDGCSACDSPDDAWLWRDDRWGVRTWTTPRAFPSVLLYPRAHHDLADFPEELATGIGPALQRTARALEMLDGIARVHVEKRGDGEEHMHWYLLARPEGLMQCRGSFLPLWDMLLAPMPREMWRATGRQLRTNLEHIGGTGR